MNATVIPTLGLVLLRHRVSDSEGVLQAAARLGDLLAQAARRSGNMGSPRAQALVAQEGAITAVMVVRPPDYRGRGGWRFYQLPANADEIVASWRDQEKTLPVVQAAELYEDLHGGDEPDEIRPVQLELPSAAAELGRLEAVEYAADRGDGLATYRHVFEDPLPILGVTPDTRRLHILEGGYTVTERGIEG